MNTKTTTARPAKPVTKQGGVGTTADPTNCRGSGKTWETGGKCPECALTANALQDAYQVTARQGAGLTPRVPRHPALDNTRPPAQDARTARDAAVLNGISKNSTPPATSASSRPGRRTKSNKTATSAAPAAPPGPARPGKTARDPVPSSPVPARQATPKTKAERKTKDPLTAPFTKTIEEYLEWFEATLTTGGLDFTKIPRKRLAGLAITMYGRFQVSPEHRAKNDH